MKRALCVLALGALVVGTAVATRARHRCASKPPTAARQARALSSQLIAPHQGQAPFVLRQPGRAIFFTESGYALNAVAAPADLQSGRGVAVRWHLVDSSPVAPAGGDPLPSRVHVLKAAHSTDLPTYGSVMYAGVHPGVDLTVRPT